MSVDQMETNFSKLSHGDFILKLYNLADRLQDHAAFKDHPEYVPGPTTFRDLAGLLQKSVDAAAHGDKQKIEELDGVRAKSAAAITFAGQHVVMVSTYRGDPAMLNNIGLDLRHRTYSKPSNNSPGKLSKLGLKNGATSGTVVVTVNKMPGAGSIDLQITDGDPTVESSWRSLERSYQCRTEVKGLEPVKRYYFRARFHNAGGAGPWSAIVNIVVV